MTERSREGSCCCEQTGRTREQTNSKIVHEAGHDFIAVRDHVDGEGAAQVTHHADRRTAHLTLDEIIHPTLPFSDLELLVVLEAGKQNGIQVVQVVDKVSLHHWRR